MGEEIAPLLRNISKGGIILVKKTFVNPSFIILRLSYQQPTCDCCYQEAKSSSSLRVSHYTDLRAKPKVVDGNSTKIQRQIGQE